ncbi:DUF3775 domain-containing protein [Idiomarina abyssalis]|uniref:Uncharacterized protein n=1 Tax=Idiomarina abyssalis TaxID=86102 RepID=A0A8I1KK87_9GAMM|nr:DUF3775 domain-containing protein [Idiomarina abyssalis]MBJ7265432.1 hypothetical protein [Idiomarina abyssalis]MBJ7316894.1 hypothetical protein [Idiomarina abyssalis]
MSIHSHIDTLKNSVPLNQSQADSFLASLSEKEQEQIIAAIYIGRDHLHDQELASGYKMDRKIIDHISKAEYGRIIVEKNTAVKQYLDALTRCAGASGFDLDKL